MIGNDGASHGPHDPCVDVDSHAVMSVTVLTNRQMLVNCSGGGDAAELIAAVGEYIIELAEERGVATTVRRHERGA